MGYASDWESRIEDTLRELWLAGGAGTAGSGGKLSAPPLSEASRAVLPALDDPFILRLAARGAYEGAVVAAAMAGRNKAAWDFETFCTACYDALREAVVVRAAAELP